MKNTLKKHFFDEVIDQSSYPSAWLGIKYHTEMKNNLTESEKDGKIQAFIASSDRDLKAKNVQKFMYLDRIGRSNILDGYIKAIEKSPKFNGINSIVLVPMDTPFETRNEGAFGKIVFSFILGAFFWFLILLLPNFDEERLKIFIDRSIPKINFQWKEYLFLFIPCENYIVTPCLMNLNIIIFLLMFFSGSGFRFIEGQDLIQWGANYRPYIEEGQYWRLLSNTFLHGGIIHLATNMGALVLLGQCLEPILGRFKMILVYILTGILASLASYYWCDAISVGASGAILGLLGTGLVIFNVKNILEPESKIVVLTIFGVVALGSMCVGLIYPNIDHAAHIGGFLSGCVAGFCIAKFGTIQEVFLENYSYKNKYNVTVK